MQKLHLDTIKKARKKKAKRLEKKVLDDLTGLTDGEMIKCRICLYESRRNKATCKVFKDNGKTSIKCFACGAWRKE